MWKEAPQIQSLETSGQASLCYKDIQIWQGMGVFYVALGRPTPWGLASIRTY